MIRTESNIYDLVEAMLDKIEAKLSNEQEQLEDCD